MKTAKFKHTVWSYYRAHGRTGLPWRRKSVTPYEILVSEVMLQQTQVDRVVPKFNAFIKQFPNFASLARAKQSTVLRLWQGLGYNRRALNLKRAAETVLKEHHGRLPRDEDSLRALPGIGPYIAGAVRAFAFNIPGTFIETNIRTVFLHHFFGDTKNVHDDEIIPLITKTLDTKQPREWYAALMDYGTHLKKTLPNPSRKSKHHTRQSKFEGSYRQKRGKVLKILSENSTQTTTQITRHLGEPSTPILKQLALEGFVIKVNGHWELA